MKLLRAALFVSASASLSFASISCSSDDGSPGTTTITPPATVDPTEATDVSADALDDLLLESALLDETPEPNADTSLSGGQGQGDMDGGGPLDGGGNADAGAGHGSRWRIAKPLYELLRAWAAVVPSSCTTESGWTDADGDGIPANTTLTFACSTQPGAGATIDATGAVTVSDTNDASADSGYTLDFQSFHVKVTRPNGTSRERTISGTVTVTVLGTPPALGNGLTVVRDLTIAQTNDTGADSKSWTHATTSSATYVPDLPADPFATGALTASGKGTTAVQIGDRAWTRTWTRATDPQLHWNRACRLADPTVPGFDSGAILHTDEHGNVLRIAFTACGVWTTTLNGAAI